MNANGLADARDLLRRGLEAERAHDVQHRHVRLDLLGEEGAKLHGDEAIQAVGTD